MEFLNREIKWVNASKGLICSLENTGYHGQLPADKELMVIRIAQEAMQNTLKHAEATHLHIRIGHNEKLFKMTITDNGKGFSHTGSPSDGLGLQSMYQRAELIKAKLDIQSAGTGTTLTLLIPEEAGKTAQKELKAMFPNQKKAPLL